MNALNAEKYLREAIDSVFAQTYGDWEIVLWDNASSDRTGEIARSYGERVRVFRGETTVPLGHARNLALAKARGELLAFLDCDDAWFPQKLERQVPLFDADPRVGIVFSGSVFFHQETGRERTVRPDPRAQRGMVFREMLARYFLSMETVVVRRAALDGLKEWFDPRFDLIEEADLFTRIAHDWKIDLVEEPLARWRIHGESWTWRKSGLFAVELRQMLDKYDALYEGFSDEHREEIRRVEARIAYWAGVERLKAGQGREMRRLLRPHLRADLRLVVPYAFSLLRYPTYRRLMRALMRGA